jgi:hypothetical protein
MHFACEQEAPCAVLLLTSTARATANLPIHRSAAAALHSAVVAPQLAFSLTNVLCPSCQAEHNTGEAAHAAVAAAGSAAYVLADVCCSLLFPGNVHSQEPMFSNAKSAAAVQLRTHCPAQAPALPAALSTSGVASLL